MTQTTSKRYQETPQPQLSQLPALLELYQYVDKKTGKRYYQAAVKTLKSLASPSYLAAQGTNGNFLLKHCVGSIPHKNEIDVPLVYADYYFLEALHRYKNSKGIK